MNLRKHIAERLVELISLEMGYSFDRDRIERIADQSLRLGRNGYASLMSTALAFELDFLLYGDPHAPITQLKGFDSVLKEIYGEEETK